MNEELIELGKVIEASEHSAKLEIIASDNCEECSAKLFCKPNENSSKILSIINSSGLKRGDNVLVTIKGKNLVFASLNLYLYPLIILVISILIGIDLFPGSAYRELYSLNIGIIIVSIYYFAFFYLSKRTSTRQSNVIIKKI